MTNDRWIISSDWEGIESLESIPFNRQTVAKSVLASGGRFVYEPLGSFRPGPRKIRWLFVPTVKGILESVRYPGQVVFVVHRAPTDFRFMRDRLMYPYWRFGLKRAAHLAVWDTLTEDSLLKDGYASRQVTMVPHPVDHEFFHPAPIGTTLYAPGDHRRDENVIRAIAASGIAPVVRSTRVAEIIEQYAGLANVHACSCREFSEIRDLFHQSQIVLVPLEPFVVPTGLTVILEGMACGRVVVASKAKGTAGYIEDGKTGVLVDSSDPKEWIRVVHDLSQDAARLKRIGDNARQAILDRHTFSRTGEVWAKIWETTNSAG